MIILDFISTLIESFLISYTVLSYFNLSYKKMNHCIFLSLICMIETYLFNYLVVNNSFLIIALSLTQASYIIIKRKNISLTYFVIPIILWVGLLFCNMIALGIVGFASNTSITQLSSKFSLFAVAIVLSRLIIWAFCVMFLKFTKHKEEFIDIKKYWTYFVFLLLLSLMISTLTEAITYQTLSIEIIYYLLLELILLVIFGVVLFALIHKQTRENYLYSQKLMEYNYQVKLGKLVQKSLNEISKDKHMMKYTLITLKNALKQNDIKKMEYILNNELNKYLDYKFISSTNNYYFDYEITNKIHEFVKSGIKTKVTFSINERNELLNDDEIVSYIMYCLDEIYKRSNKGDIIDISLNERGTYLVFKIIVPNLNKNNLIFKNSKGLKKQDTITQSEQVVYSFLFDARS